MFTKQTKVGGGQYGVYKTVIDWDAVWGAVAMVAIAAVMLKACGG